MVTVDSGAERRPEIISLLIEQIHGAALERELEELGNIGGHRISPTEFSVTRPALSELDMEARKYLKEKMGRIGMSVEEHPFGLIGIYEGTDPSKPKVLALSHFDSVPDGGNADGTVGIIGANASIEAMHSLGIKPKRSIMVVALTGEEGYKFNFALFGSRGLFHGLTNEELEQHRDGDMTIREALEKLQFNPNLVRTPRFTSHDIVAAIELHVAQDARLNDGQADIAIIEAIAAAHRFSVTIDTERALQPSDAPGLVYAIDIAGKAGHSGATPMRPEFRADGLLVASDLLRRSVLFNEQMTRQGKAIRILIGDLKIQSQSINKIPGPTQLYVKIVGSAEDQEAMRAQLDTYIAQKNMEITQGKTHFDDNPISLQEVTSTQTNVFYEASSVDRLFRQSGKIIRRVNVAATRYSSEGVVGTVGLFNFIDGKVTLGIDVRGISLEPRERAVQEIMDYIHTVNTGITTAIKELAGTDKPSVMDVGLIALAEKVIKDNHIGTYKHLFSLAGHDIQNVVRAGIPGVMLFIPSRNDGAAHNPREFSSPKDLEIGARALAAMLYEKAMM